MSNKSATVQEVLEELRTGDQLPEDELARLKDYYERVEETSSSPWYVRGCVGFSAWLAAIFFIAFLFISEILDSESSGAMAGLIFYFVAIIWRRSEGGRGDFSAQGSLALVLAGQLLILFGIGDLFDYDTSKIALLTLVMELVLIWFYPDQILRFIATIASATSIYVLVQEVGIQFLFPIFATLLALGTVYLWKQEMKLSVSKNFGRIYRPVGYGLAVSAVGVVTLPDFRWIIGGYQWHLAIGLLFVLLYILYGILSGGKVDLRSQGAYAVLGGAILLTIPALLTPGILIGLALLLLGFERGNRALQGIAGAFLAYFVTLFYYDLQITLLEKSYILVGTGLLFFGIRYLLRTNLFPPEAEA